MSARTSLILCLVAIVAAAPLAARADAPEVGKSVVVENEVSIVSGAETHALLKDAVVRQDEVVVTSKNASAEIELLDKTKLAVGPEAKIVLDKFVYDAGAAPGSISINLTKGAFRFITGLSPKTSYVIKTPTASMGIRGTVFDVFVAENGETAVLLHEGGVDVCATSKTCRRHNKKGHVVFVSLARTISSPLRWEGSIMKGVAVATAFPFVGKTLVLDPVARVGRSAMFSGAQIGKSVGKAVTAPVKGLRKIIRRPRLPF